jgi:alanine dehydrogenase
VQTTAGEGSGFFDKDYIDVGAVILPTIAEVYAKSDMIIKVKEPIVLEYPLVRENQIIFTYFHFVSSESLTKAMIASKSICIAYEMV